MSLFGALFGNRGPVFDDRIWLTEEAKTVDLTKQVEVERGSDMFPLIIHHFDDTGSYMEAALQKAGVLCCRVTNFSVIQAGDVSSWKKTGDAVIVNSNIVPSAVQRGEATRTKISGAKKVHVHLCEHHPALLRDTHVLNLDKFLPLDMHFTCYTGLDEPWFKGMGMDQIKEIMIRLGLDESVPLQHDMITRALLNAQKKMARRVRQEIPCVSCEEWVQRNLT